MKKGVLLFLAASLIFVFYGWSQAGQASQKKGGPEIVIEPKIFDFGEIEYGQVGVHKFSFKNTGDETLEIKRVSTSCGCTTAIVDNERIEPGGKGELLVTYDSGAMGKSVIDKRIERFIYLKTNDPQNLQAEVVIYANVR